MLIQKADMQRQAYKREPLAIAWQAGPGRFFQKTDTRA
jgi:hypothetical protein